MTSRTFEELCAAGDVTAVRQQRSKLLVLRDRGMIAAARNGHVPIVQLMIQQGAQNWHGGLDAAARGGHQHIVQLMIDQGANDWNWGLYSAAAGGHQHIVQLMIERGANHWTRGLCGAALGGHMSIIQLMIERGANDWNQGLRSAATGGHMPIVLMMIERGANVWSGDVVALLHAHPEEVIHLARCGHVARHLFAQHSRWFELWIREDEQVRWTASNLLLSHNNNDRSGDVITLPYELSELALSY